MAVPAPACTANQTMAAMPSRTNAPTDSSMLDCFIQKTGYSSRLLRRVTSIVAKASHNAIVRGSELGRGALEMDPAFLEQGNAIAGGERFRDIVGHYQSSKIKLLPVTDDHFENSVARRGIKTGCRFVEKHQFGTRDQGASECEAFLHSAGHLRGKMIGKFFQAEAF